MTQLIRYETACRALAECKAVDEVKAWSDKAAAMQAYGRIAKDKTLEVDAAEIRLRAHRRLGELLAQQKAGDGLNAGVKLAGKSADGSALVTNEGRKVPTLAEAGISYDLSSRAQKLAAVPADEFEREVGEWRERVSEEGARVSAKLEQSGERAMKGKPAPVITQVQPPANDELREQINDLASMLEEVRADNESMVRVFEADDKVTAALAEAKRYREQLRIVESRITGLTNERNEAIRQARMWQRRCEKLEKSGANLAA